MMANHKVVSKIVEETKSEPSLYSFQRTSTQSGAAPADMSRPLHLTYTLSRQYANTAHICERQASGKSLPRLIIL
jgi:hypothetical protein